MWARACRRAEKEWKARLAKERQASDAAAVRLEAVLHKGAAGKAAPTPQQVPAPPAPGPARSQPRAWPKHDPACTRDLCGVVVVRRGNGGVGRVRGGQGRSIEWQGGRKRWREAGR
jgi:hypothetical protein